MDKMQIFFESLFNYITLQNISFLLGLIGSVGTAWNILRRRKNLIIKGNYAYDSKKSVLTITVMFENRSSLPITITSVEVFSGSRRFPVVDYPRVVGTGNYKHNGEIVHWKFLYNLNFPVGISQFGAVSGKILLDDFQEAPETLSTPLTLVTHSTRGSAQETQLTNNQTS